MFWHIYVVCFQPNLPWSIDHFPAACWHWRLAWFFFVFVWACWQLVPHRSKLKNGNSCSWQQITFGTECWIFCGKMLEKSPVFWLGYAFFLVRLTVTVGFGPVDGWFLTGPNSKLERVSASWQQITFGTECWIFFRGKRLGKSPVFWLGYAFLFGEADGGTLQIICMCFLDSFGPVDGGFLTGPKIKIEKKPFFLRTERSTVPWISYSMRTCTEHAPRISFSNWFYNQDNSDSVTTASIFRLTNSPPVTLSRKHSQWWRSRWRRLRRGRGLVGRSLSGKATSEGASSQLHRPVWRTGFCKKNGNNRVGFKSVVPCAGVLLQVVSGG